MKKKIIVLICILSAVAIAVGAIFTISNINNANRTAYPVPLITEDGFVPQLKIPKGSTYLGEAGFTVMWFETSYNEKEIIEFYNNYFSSLVIVQQKNEQFPVTGYYDNEQRTIFFNLETTNIENDKYRFIISAEICEDINNNSDWELKKE